MGKVYRMDMYDPEFSYVFVEEQPAQLRINREKYNGMATGDFLVIEEIKDNENKKIKTGSKMEMDVEKVKHYKSVKEFLEKEGCSVASLFAFNDYVDIKYENKKIGSFQRKIINKSADAIEYVSKIFETQYGFSLEMQQNNGVLGIWMKPHRGRGHF